MASVIETDYDTLRNELGSISGPQSHDHWDSIFAPTPAKPRQVFDPVSDDEGSESPKTVSAELLKGLSRQRDSSTRLHDEDEILFSPDNSDGSRSPGEETSYNHSHDSSNSGHDEKRGFNGSMTEQSMPETVDFGSSDFAHTFILSPFAPRLNYHIGHDVLSSALNDIPAYNLDDHAHHNDHQDEPETKVVKKAEVSHPPVRTSSRAPVKKTLKDSVEMGESGYDDDDDHATRPRAKRERKEHRLTSSHGSPMSPKSNSDTVVVTAMVVDGGVVMRKFACNFDNCTASFNRQSHLERHQLSHTGERPFACVADGCDKRFTRKEHLKRHIDNTHGSLGSNICDECNKPFKDQWNLRKHKASKHGSE